MGKSRSFESNKPFFLWEEAVLSMRESRSKSEGYGLKGVKGYAYSYEFYYLCTMTIELNEVLLPGEEHSLSLLADEGQLTCITGGTADRRTRWLHVLMGFEVPSAGCVSVDGEPLAGGCITHLRKHIAFAPACLETVGQLVPYEPPTFQDVLALHANKNLGINEADIEEECQRIGANDQKALLLAVAVLRRKPVLLVDSPLATSGSYLLQQAHQEGRTVIVATGDTTLIGFADNVVEIA